MQPLISVIIPMYNVEKYLRQCIDSVLEQTYQNLEIILVDDGSPDNCGKICDEYAELDSRINVIHKKNGGLSDARNVGIEIAKGEYITFIDSDDFITKDYVEYLYQLLENGNADMSVCQRLDVDEEGVSLNIKINVKEQVVVGNRECMRAYVEERSVETAAWGKLYKTEMFKQVRYPVGKYHEDVFTTYLLIAQCEKIAIGSEQKYGYRSRTESITKSSFSKKHLDSVEGTIKRGEFVGKKYPEFAQVANSQIVYAANYCVMKMIKAEVVDTQSITELQKVYRKYEHDFLKGTSRIAAKAFSLFAYVNLSLLVRTMLMFNKIRK